MAADELESKYSHYLKVTPVFEFKMETEFLLPENFLFWSLPKLSVPADGFQKEKEILPCSSSSMSRSHEVNPGQPQQLSKEICKKKITNSESTTGRKSNRTSSSILTPKVPKNKQKAKRNLNLSLRNDSASSVKTRIGHSHQPITTRQHPPGDTISGKQSKVPSNNQVKPTTRGKDLVCDCNRINDSLTDRVLGTEGSSCAVCSVAANVNDASAGIVSMAKCPKEQNWASNVLAKYSDCVNTVKDFMDASHAICTNAVADAGTVCCSSSWPSPVVHPLELNDGMCGTIFDSLDKLGNNGCTSQRNSRNSEHKNESALLSSCAFDSDRMLNDVFCVDPGSSIHSGIIQLDSAGLETNFVDSSTAKTCIVCDDSDEQPINRSEESFDSMPSCYNHNVVLQLVSHLVWISNQDNLGLLYEVPNTHADSEMLNSFELKTNVKDEIQASFTCNYSTSTYPKGFSKLDDSILVDFASSVSAYSMDCPDVPLFDMSCIGLNSSRVNNDCVQAVDCARVTSASEGIQKDHLIKVSDFSLSPSSSDLQDFNTDLPQLTSQESLNPSASPAFSNGDSFPAEIQDGSVRKLLQQTSLHDVTFQNSTTGLDDERQQGSDSVKSGENQELKLRSHLDHSGSISDGVLLSDCYMVGELSNSAFFDHIAIDNDNTVADQAVSDGMDFNQNCINSLHPYVSSSCVTNILIEGHCSDFVGMKESINFQGLKDFMTKVNTTAEKPAVSSTPEKPCHSMSLPDLRGNECLNTLSCSMCSTAECIHGEQHCYAANSVFSSNQIVQSTSASIPGELELYLSRLNQASFSALSIEGKLSTLENFVALDEFTTDCVSGSGSEPKELYDVAGAETGKLHQTIPLAETFNRPNTCKEALPVMKSNEVDHKDTFCVGNSSDDWQKPLNWVKPCEETLNWVKPSESDQNDTLCTVKLSESDQQETWSVFKIDEDPSTVEKYLKLCGSERKHTFLVKPRVVDHDKIVSAFHLNGCAQEDTQDRICCDEQRVIFVTDTYTSDAKKALRVDQSRDDTKEIVQEADTSNNNTEATISVGALRMIFQEASNIDDGGNSGSGKEAVSVVDAKMNDQVDVPMDENDQAVDMSDEIETKVSLKESASIIQNENDPQRSILLNEKKLDTDKLTSSVQRRVDFRETVKTNLSNVSERSLADSPEDDDADVGMAFQSANEDWADLGMGFCISGDCNADVGMALQGAKYEVGNVVLVSQGAGIEVGKGIGMVLQSSNEDAIDLGMSFDMTATDGADVDVVLQGANEFESDGLAFHRVGKEGRNSIMASCSPTEAGNGDNVGLLENVERLLRLLNQDTNTANEDRVRTRGEWHAESTSGHYAVEIDNALQSNGNVETVPTKECKQTDNYCFSSDGNAKQTFVRLGNNFSNFSDRKVGEFFCKENMFPDRVTFGICSLPASVEESFRSRRSLRSQMFISKQPKTLLKDSHLVCSDINYPVSLDPVPVYDVAKDRSGIMWDVNWIGESVFQSDFTGQNDEKNDLVYPANLSCLPCDENLYATESSIPPFPQLRCLPPLPSPAPSPSYLRLQLADITDPVAESCNQVMAIGIDCEKLSRPESSLSDKRLQQTGRRSLGTAEASLPIAKPGSRPTVVCKISTDNTVRSEWFLMPDSAYSGKISQRGCVSQIGVKETGTDERRNELDVYVPVHCNDPIPDLEIKLNGAWEPENRAHFMLTSESNVTDRPLDRLEDCDIVNKQNSMSSYEKRSAYHKTLLDRVSSDDECLVSGCMTDAIAPNTSNVDFDTSLDIDCNEAEITSGANTGSAVGVQFSIQQRESCTSCRPMSYECNAVGTSLMENAEGFEHKLVSRLAHENDQLAFTIPNSIENVFLQIPEQSERLDNLKCDEKMENEVREVAQLCDGSILGKSESWQPSGQQTLCDTENHHSSLGMCIDGYNIPDDAYKCLLSNFEDGDLNDLHGGREMLESDEEMGDCLNEPAMNYVEAVAMPGSTMLDGGQMLYCTGSGMDWNTGGLPGHFVAGSELPEELEIEDIAMRFMVCLENTGQVDHSNIDESSDDNELIAKKLNRAISFDHDYSAFDVADGRVSEAIDSSHGSYDDEMSSSYTGQQQQQQVEDDSEEEKTSEQLFSVNVLTNRLASVAPNDSCTNNQTAGASDVFNCLSRKDVCKIPVHAESHNTIAESAKVESDGVASNDLTSLCSKDLIIDGIHSGYLKPADSNQVNTFDKICANIDDSETFDSRYVLESLRNGMKVNVHECHEQVECVPHDLKPLSEDDGITVSENCDRTLNQAADLISNLKSQAFLPHVTPFQSFSSTEKTDSVAVSGNCSDSLETSSLHLPSVISHSALPSCSSDRAKSFENEVVSVDYVDLLTVVLAADRSLLSCFGLNRSDLRQDKKIPTSACNVLEPTLNCTDSHVQAFYTGREKHPGVSLVSSHSKYEPVSKDPLTVKCDSVSGDNHSTGGREYLGINSEFGIKSGSLGVDYHFSEDDRALLEAVLDAERGVMKMYQTIHERAFGVSRLSSGH